MQKEQREWALFGVMAVLIAAVIFVAWRDVPELEPASVTYNTTAATTEPTETTTTETAPLCISLNTATAAELMQLDGLGAKTAAKILEYREVHHGFDKVEELLEVDGVGEKKFEAWKPYLTV